MHPLNLVQASASDFSDYYYTKLTFLIMLLQISVDKGHLSKPLFFDIAQKNLSRVEQKPEMISLFRRKLVFNHINRISKSVTNLVLISSLGYEHKELLSRYRQSINLPRAAFGHNNYMHIISCAPPLQCCSRH